jgi:NADH dehydrogenase
MRVAVLGAGYAGLTVACRLDRRLPDGVELVVVDEADHHLVQHELHRLIRYPDLAEAITVPLDGILDRASIRQARVTDVDPNAGVATLAPVDATDGATETLSYDAAAVCLGARTAFHDLPAVEAAATPLKRIPHADAIRTDALDADGGTAVVGGAGLSGVQAAGELAELSRERDLGMDVTLLEMADRIAPRFDATFADAVRTELEARDVAVETGATVQRADEATVSLADGWDLPHDVFVWTGGIRGPEALDGERRAVEADLRVGDATFVVGDAGAVADAAGESVPASAQTAVQQARVAADNVMRLVNDARVTDAADDAPGPAFREYRYEEAGWVVSVGDGAVAMVGPAVVTGDVAKGVKAAIAAGHLGSVGAIERAATVVHEELGWPGIDVLEGSGLAASLDRYAPTGGTDPSSPTAVERQLVGPLVELSESLGTDGTVDLTGLTRAADRAHPGSPANLLVRAAFTPVDVAGDVNIPGLGTSGEDENHPIDDAEPAGAGSGPDDGDGAGAGSGPDDGDRAGSGSGPDAAG